MSHGPGSHAHARAAAANADRRWLLGAFAVVVAFMGAEVIAGLLAHSLALLTDAGHMVTDAAALLVAVIASKIAQRPARGAYTYGFARVDALSGQANGITLLLLALWFTVEGIRRLVHPGAVHGGVVAVVALVGVVVNLLATWLTSRADRTSLNVRGVLAHLLTDIWAFAATFVAGVVIVVSGWSRADAVASLVVAVAMAGPASDWSGPRAGCSSRPRRKGSTPMRSAPTWPPSTVWPSCTTCTSGRSARGSRRCRRMCWWGRPTTVTRSARGCGRCSPSATASGHVTLQADHADAPAHDAEHCEDAHGQVHLGPPA